MFFLCTCRGTTTSLHKSHPLPSACFQIVQDLNYFVGDTDLERSTPTLQTSIPSLFQVSLKSYPFEL